MPIISTTEFERWIGPAGEHNRDYMYAYFFKFAAFLQLRYMNDNPLCITQLEAGRISFGFLQPETAALAKSQPDNRFHTPTGQGIHSDYRTLIASFRDCFLKLWDEALITIDDKASDQNPAYGVTAWRSLLVSWSEGTDLALRFDENCFYKNGIGRPIGGGSNWHGPIISHSSRLEVGRWPALPANGGSIPFVLSMRNPPFETRIFAPFWKRRSRKYGRSDRPEWRKTYEAARDGKKFIKQREKLTASPNSGGFGASGKKPGSSTFYDRAKKIVADAAIEGVKTGVKTIAARQKKTIVRRIKDNIDRVVKESKRQR